MIPRQDRFVIVAEITIGRSSGQMRRERHRGGCHVLATGQVYPEQYDAVREIVAFERETAPGGLFHVAAVDDQGIHVTDVWETEEQFRTYLADRLLPAFAQMGINGQPEVEIIPVHALITPGFSRV